MDTLTPTFTIAELEAKIREIAAEQPDYVYAKAGGLNSCFYSKSDKGVGNGCRCIVGEALFRLGVNQQTLERFDGSEKMLTGAYRLLKKVFGFAEFSGFVPRVQSLQDKGHRWGEAVRIADLNV
jgi:hypothetical protein